MNSSKIKTECTLRCLKMLFIWLKNCLKKNSLISDKEMADYTPSNLSLKH